MRESMVQPWRKRTNAWLCVVAGMLLLGLAGCSRSTEMEVHHFEVTPVVVDPAPNGAGSFDITFDAKASEDFYVLYLTWVPRGETDQNSPNRVAPLDLSCSATLCPPRTTQPCKYRTLETDPSRRVLQCAQGNAYRFEISPGEYTLIASFVTGFDEFKKASSVQVLTDMSLR